MGLFGTIVNNIMAEKREGRARAENYRYGEMAADMADTRTRALYGDLYSPSAQVKQLREAGLSPSLFYGDGGGISGQTGAMGSGSGNISPNVFGFDPITSAQIANINADTRLKQNQANNVQSETDLNEIEKSMQEMKKKNASINFNLLNSFVILDDGSYSSLSSEATKYNSFHEYLNKCRDIAEKTYGKESKFFESLYTETGLQTMRSIYLANKKLNSEIATFENSAISENLAKTITQKLAENDYANLNAKQITQDLKTATAEAEMDETTKNAWNNLLDKLGEKSETAKDVVIVISMIIDRIMSKWSNVNLSRQKKDVNVTHNK